MGNNLRLATKVVAVYAIFSVRMTTGRLGMDYIVLIVIMATTIKPNFLIMSILLEKE